VHAKRDNRTWHRGVVSAPGRNDVGLNTHVADEVALSIQLAGEGVGGGRYQWDGRRHDGTCGPDTHHKFARMNAVSMLQAVSDS